MDGILIVRFIAVCGGGTRVPFTIGRDGALFLCFGLLRVRGILAGSGGTMGHYTMVCMDRRDVVDGMEKAVVLVDGVVGSGQSGCQHLEGGVKIPRMPVTGEQGITNLFELNLKISLWFSESYT